ncbi:MAG: AAA family ATPase [Candidatus Paceibacterota bacterium]
MILSRININNYRGVKKAENIPINPLSVLVGKNDSGKSIVLNAIAAFLSIKDYPIFEIDFNNPEQPIYFEVSFTDDDLAEKVSKKIGTKIKKDDGKDEFITDICTGDNISFRRSIKSPGKAFDETLIAVRDYDHEDFKELYQKSDEEVSTILDKYDIEVPVAGAGRNSKLEKVKHIKQYCNENEIDIKTSWINDDYDIAKLLPEIELFNSDYGIEPDTPFKTSSVTEVKGVLDEEAADGGKLTEVAKKVEKEMGIESEAISILMKDYVPNVKAVSIKPNFTWKDAIKSVDVNFEFEDDDKPINMTRKGSGYRRLFMVARFRYLAQKKKGDDVIYAIEEPETFLHPSAQEDLLNALKEISNENQIILATHSPVFAGSSDRSSIVLCEKTPEGSKYISEVDDPDVPSRIIEELGIRPQHNLRDKYTKILFCESKHDIRFYDVLAKSLLGKSIINNDSILALPGGGDSLEDIINIDYFTKTKRKLYLLTDSDKHRDESKQTTNKERVERFENLDSAKGYLTKKACIENYYHPRAFERIYSDLPEGTCKVFTDTDDVNVKLRDLMDRTGVQIKLKNGHEVFTETTKEEWQEIVETELVDFIKEITE